MHLESEVVVHNKHEFNAALAPLTGLTSAYRKGRHKAAPGEVQWIERRAKLFEAGNFPDKGVNVTQEQLDALVQNFQGPVPVLIEHSENPLELGFLTRVESLDGELFGTVTLSKEANDLVERSGARSLSLGLSEDLTEIREVSLVRNPRVKDAQLFTSCFRGALESFAQSSRSLTEHTEPEPARDFTQSARSLMETTVLERSEEFTDSTWRSRYEALQAENRRDEAERKVQEFVREGRLSPAQAPFAGALLQAEQTIDFDGDSQSVRQLLIAMIERQPPLQLFSALAPETVSRNQSARLMPEEADFYRRHFPDVSLDEIAARK